MADVLAHMRDLDAIDLAASGTEQRRHHACGNRPAIADAAPVSQKRSISGSNPDRQRSLAIALAKENCN